MESTQPIEVTFPGGRCVDARVGDYLVRTDQPISNGGNGTAPSPFQLFLASMGSCAGIFIQGFCANRGISVEGIRLIETPAFNEEGVLSAVDLTIQLPTGFPEKYRTALTRVVEQCSVKRAILARPIFTVTTQMIEENAHVSASAM